MNTKHFKTLSIIAIFIAIIGLSLGYAALSQTLNINTTATVQSSANSWKILFKNADAGSASANADKGTIALTDTTVTVSGVILKAPGSSVTYTFDVVNEGEVDAKLSTITNLEAVITGSGASKDADETLVRGGYQYTLTYNDGGTIAAEDTLAVGASKKLKLVVSYKDTVTELPAADVVMTNLGTTLVYVQA